MEIQIETTELKSIMKHIVGVLPSKNIKPILGSVRIMAENSDKIIFEATDMESAIQIAIPGIVKNPGTVLIRAKELYEISKNAIGNHITISDVNGRINIDTEKGHVEMSFMPSDEFPSLGLCDQKSKQITITKSKLIELIEGTIIFSSDDEYVKSLNGLHFTFGKNYIQIDGADGVRLARFSVPAKADDTLQEPVAMTIPKKAIKNLLEILKEEKKDEITMMLELNRFGIKGEKITYTTRLLDLQYPDFEKVIPDEQKYKIGIEFNTGMFLKSLKFVSALIKNGENVVIKITEEKIVLSSSLSGVGETNVDVECIFLSDPIPLEIGFNPKLLIDAMSCLNAETFQMFFTGVKKPCVIKSKMLPGYIQIIMPVLI